MPLYIYTHIHIYDLWRSVHVNAIVIVYPIHPNARRCFQESPTAVRVTKPSWQTCRWPRFGTFFRLGRRWNAQAKRECLRPTETILRHFVDTFDILYRYCRCCFSSFLGTPTVLDFKTSFWFWAAAESGGWDHRNCSLVLWQEVCIYTYIYNLAHVNMYSTIHEWSCHSFEVLTWYDKGIPWGRFSGLPSSRSKVTLVQQFKRKAPVHSWQWSCGWKDSLFAHGWVLVGCMFYASRHRLQSVSWHEYGAIWGQAIRSGNQLSFQVLTCVPYKYYTPPK